MARLDEKSASERNKEGITNNDQGKTKKLKEPPRKHQLVRRERYFVETGQNDDSS
jgi:hypothetical protein